MTEPKPINRELGPAYVGHSKPVDLELARLQFEERYGYQPAEIIDMKYNLLIGPVKEKEREDYDE